MRQREDLGKEEGDGCGPSPSLEGSLDPEHPREQVRGVASVAGAGARRRRRRGAGSWSTRIARDVGFLSDLWGRGFSSRGNDVGRAGLPPVQMHPNVAAGLPGPTQPEVLWPREIAGIPGGSLATKRGLRVGAAGCENIGEICSLTPALNRSA